MSQPPFEAAMHALAGLWGPDAKAAVQAQEAAGLSLAALLATVPAMTAADPPLASPSGDGLAEAAKAVADLWAAAASMSSTLSAMMGTAETGLDPTMAAARRAIADPRHWFATAGGLDSMAAQLGEAQSAGMGSAERQQARLTQAWLGLRRCTLEHDAVALGAWLRAGGAFNAAAAHAQAEGRPVVGQAALALWATAANAVLMEAQRGERFLQTQAAMVRAGAELRLAQRDLAEHWAEQFGMPTRTEMDDVHRTVTELRREVRALRRQAQGGAAPP